MGKGGRPNKVHEDLTQLRRLVKDGDEKSVQRIMQNHGIGASDGNRETALIWASFSIKLICPKNDSKTKYISKPFNFL